MNWIKSHYIKCMDSIARVTNIGLIYDGDVVESFDVSFRKCSHRSV